MKGEGIEMRTIERATRKPGMSIRDALMYYVVCLVGFALLVYLAIDLKETTYAKLAIVFYLFAGTLLNRTVLRRNVSWNRARSTLYNISEAKLRFFMLWPIKYFVLFVRIGIAEVL